LYAFHKYWGKKPAEPISFLIENLTDTDEVVLDPFVGSGVVAREAARLQRRFVGIDLNPIAIELSKLLVAPPEPGAVESGLAEIEARARQEIDDSYRRGQADDVATHYLWDREALREVWVVKRRGGRGRRVYQPTENDLRQSDKYHDYQSRHIRPLRFFTNSRVNASPDLTLNHLFTGRALRNMDVLLDAIDSLPLSVQPAFRLCATAASGQMSNMVFAITRRGKTTGARSGKVEVGSWVIGYWRPHLHFEINAWNCFSRRAHKLASGVRASSLPALSVSSEDPSDVLRRQANVALCCDDTLNALRGLPDNSVDLIVTDPPHSDRVPYLELSEIWNAILGYSVDFRKEIVVSNAKERRKGLAKYNQSMKEFVALAGRVLKWGRFMVILFNARDPLSWEYLRALSDDRGESALEYRGHFPISYSARSVVQDSRKGSLKTDLALVFQKLGGTSAGAHLLREVRCIGGWLDTLPKQGQEQ